jgi:hypothetical protein
VLLWVTSVSNARLHIRVFMSLVTALATMLFAGLNLRAQVPGLNPGSGAAKLVSFTGQISVLRDSNPWALNLGDLVQTEQVIVTGADGYGVFQIADGSKFEVFPKSHVVFRANRGDWRDLLEVWLGKVRVQIEHPGGLPNNNKVRTPTAVISVRGTIFDVEVEDQDDTTLVVDEEGSVAVQHALRPGDPKILGPGESVRVFKNEPIARKLIDKGNFMQRAARAASDALNQAALNSSRGAPTVPRTGGVPTTGLPAEQKNGNPPPPPPPAPPPPPPPPPPPAP